MAGSARPPKKMKASKRLLRIFAGSGAGRAGTRPDRPRSRACASLTPSLPSLRSGRARLASSAGATGRASACSRTTKSGDELRGVRIRVIIEGGERRGFQISGFWKKPSYVKITSLDEHGQTITAGYCREER